MEYEIWDTDGIVAVVYDKDMADKFCALYNEAYAAKQVA